MAFVKSSSSTRLAGGQRGEKNSNEIEWWSCVKERAKKKTLLYYLIPVKLSYCYHKFPAVWLAVAGEKKKKRKKFNTGRCAQLRTRGSWNGFRGRTFLENKTTRERRENWTRDFAASFPIRFCVLLKTATVPHAWSPKFPRWIRKKTLQDVRTKLHRLSKIRVIQF